MTAGDAKRRLVQAGRESVPGTAVPATRKIPCMFSWSPQDEWIEPDVYRGDYVERYTAAQGAHWCDWQMTLPFDQAEAGFFMPGLWGDITPSTVDTTGKLYLFNDVQTSDKATYTLEYFDGNQAYQMAYCVVSDISLSFSGSGAVDLTIKGFGQQEAKIDITPGLLQNVNPPLAAWKKRLFLDDAGDAPTTEADLTLIGATMSFSNGAERVPVGNNGTRSFGHVAFGGFVSTVEIDCLMSDEILDAFDDYQDATNKSIGIEIRGPLISSVYQGIICKFTGPWKSWVGGVTNKANSVKLGREPFYDSSLGYTHQVELTNLETY